MGQQPQSSSLVGPSGADLVVLKPLGEGEAVVRVMAAARAAIKAGRSISEGIVGFAAPSCKKVVRAREEVDKAHS